MSEAAPASSKRARVLKRTLVGGSLAGGVGLLLWLSSLQESGLLVLCVGWTLALGGIIELARMQRRELPSLGWVLAGCWVLLVAMGLHSLRDEELERSFHVKMGNPPGTTGLLAKYTELLGQVIGLGLVAVIGQCCAIGLRSRSVLAKTLAGLMALWTALVVAMLLMPELLRAPRELLQELVGSTALMGLVPVAVAGWVLVLVVDRWSMKQLVFVPSLALWGLLPMVWMKDVWLVFGQGGLVALLILSKVGDIAGYYVGNAIGVRHPFPSISPGKTVAGCWASLIVGLAAGGGAVAIGLLPAGELGILGGVLAGGLINLAAQAGDLFESWLKRKSGVKDSGTWFGPSGGVLDLVDSLLFAVPAALLTWPFLLG